MRQGPAGHHEKFHRIIQTRRIALFLIDNGVEFFEIIAKQVGRQAPLTRPHPIDVPAQRIDFAVVHDVPIGVCQRPRGEGIRAETGMNEPQGRDHAGISQVREKASELLRQQHAFIDDGVGRQTTDIDSTAFHQRGLANRPGNTFPDDVQLPFKLGLVQNIARDKKLSHLGKGLLRQIADVFELHRDVAPSQKPQPFFTNDRFKEAFTLPAKQFILRQEHHPYPIATRLGQLQADVLTGTPEKFMRDLQKDPRAVTGTRIATLRPAMVQILQHVQRFFDDIV